MRPTAANRGYLSHEVKAELLARWAKIRKSAIALGWQGARSPKIEDLALKCGTVWDSKGLNLTVGKLLTYKDDNLFDIEGLGRIKCEKLLDILEKSVQQEVAVRKKLKGAKPPPPPTPAAVLKRWGVSPHYPIQLLMLPQRIQNFGLLNGVSDIRELLQVWTEEGRSGLMEEDNLGRSSLDTLQALVTAISTENVEAARQWLPLNEGGTGLCLRAGLGLCYNKLNETARQIVSHRLVDDVTLQEVGTAFNMTRERVRQLEAMYLSTVSDFIEEFEAEFRQVLHDWVADRDWTRHFLPQATPEAEALTKAGLIVFLDQTPEGILRKRNTETNILGWMEELQTHVDLNLEGVDLRAYLKNNVPTSKVPLLMKHLRQTYGLHLNADESVLKQQPPSMKWAIISLLAKSKKPLPLAEVVSRLQAIHGKGAISEAFILRNRYRWSHRKHLDLNRIIWR